MNDMKLDTDKNQDADIDLSAYRALFFEESANYLSALRRNLTRLMENPADAESVREAHRAAHTLRGMASTMNFLDLAVLGKRLESRFRSEELLTSDQIDILLAGCDEFEVGLGRLNTESEETDARDDRS
jgi:two-component system chemotaxis sensor kinase CheA